MEKKEKIMVTSALPYANGPLHLGHIAGAYLPADIYVRFNKILGNDVIYICGTDEHGVPITIKAEEEKVSPTEIVKRYHEQIKKDFDSLDIEFDNFSGTSRIHNKYHAQISREFFTNLLKNGYIISKLSDQHFCKKCDRFLPDRFIEGICPNCGYPEARGDECPQCNHQYDPLELKDPKCKICGSKPSVETTKHWYFCLNLLQKELEEWIESKSSYWKENVINFVKGWFKQGLKERAITRDLYWGVPVPLQDAAGKVLYVWFDAPIGYISSTMEWAEKKFKNIEKWKEYWKNPECKIVHFIGKDNIPFHAIIWPAMLIGQRQGYQLPWHIPANEYLNFGLGEEDKSTKASTSKGNVIWVQEAVQSVDKDMIRYYLAAFAPEKTDTLFTWKDFQLKCNGDLCDNIGNFVNRVLKFIKKNFDNKIPPRNELSEKDKNILEKINITVNNVKKYFQNFEVRNAVSEIISLGRDANQYFTEKEPWKTIKENKKDCETCMNISCQIIHTLSILLYPIIPSSALEIWKQLGNKDKIEKWGQINNSVKVGQELNSPKAIFQKLDNKLIKKLERKLEEAIKSANKQKSDEIPPLKEEKISLEEYFKVDIRIGKIIEAQNIPKSKKLLLLKVDIGKEIRQLVAGIGEYYEPKDLIGKQIPILANLMPAKIKGYESQGMILCADINGRPVLITPEKEVNNGCIIR